MSRFLRWIVNIVLIIAIVVTCGLLIPPLAGVTTVIVDDVDMPTNLARGSVTYAIPKPVSELKVGNDIVIQDSIGDYVYIIKSVDATSGIAELEDIKSTDSQARTETFTKDVSKVLFTVPFIGYITMAMKSTEGLIIIGLGIIFIVILFILSELWKKDSDEDEDEDEEDAKATAKATAAPVDLSAHILEKVSSEIGSEISSVIASDTDQASAEETVGATEELNVGNAHGQFVEEPSVVNALGQLVEEPNVVNALAHSSEEPNVGNALGHSTEAPNVVNALGHSVEELEDLEPVEMAMPTYTADELIAKAKEAGYEPEVITDEDIGVTILDYSKII